MTPKDITQLFGIPGFSVSSQSAYFDKEDNHPYVMVELTRIQKRYQCP